MDENQQLQQENNNPAQADNYMEGVPPHTPVPEAAPQAISEPNIAPPPIVESIATPEQQPSIVKEVEQEVNGIKDKVEKEDEGGSILAFILGGFFAAYLGISLK